MTTDGAGLGYLNDRSDDKDVSVLVCVCAPKTRLEFETFWSSFNIL
jgi:hypothetical protein